MRGLMVGCVAAALLSACNPKPAVPSCLTLKLADNGFSAAPPANVSLFFSVDTCATDDYASQPIANLPLDAFTVSEDGSKVSQFESQMKIQPKGVTYRLFTLMLLDTSGSIIRSGNLPQLEQAASAFIDSVLGTPGNGQQLAIATFDGRPDLQMLVNYTDNADTAKQALHALDANECTTNEQCSAYPDRATCAGHLCIDDSTNLYGAVVAGLQNVDTARSASSIPYKDSAMIVFTDGTDQAARVTRTAAVGAVQASKSHVYTLGLGGEVDGDVLTQLGKDEYIAAGDVSDLQTKFDALAQRINALANRYYLLQYCSPKRAGTHNLTVNATAPAFDKTLTGSLQQPFDASGFTSGCQIP